MKFLRSLLDKQEHHFAPRGKMEKFHAFYEALDTFLYTPGKVTAGASHVRDALDLKRMMITVVIALLPCCFMAMYNTGYQANLIISQGFEPQGWRPAFVQALGVPFSPESVFACLVHGALYFLPVLFVTFFVGGHIEALFAVVRKHEINEGFLVTGFLFPLILSPMTPLWQVAIGIAFGVIFAKEVFGGTGMNILNPALTARAFLFFAYPAEQSGDRVWYALDGYSGATWLARASESGVEVLRNGVSWWDAFLGFIPGSMGETSTLACLIGAVILIVTRVGSWRTMLGVVVGTFITSTFFNIVGSSTNPYFSVPFHWHIVLGGWAFGTVFMATDPVSSAYTEIGKYIYGLMIGILVILVRVVNPAYPEGMMLSILFMNVFAPLIDYYVINANIKRRMVRYAV